MAVALLALQFAALSGFDPAASTRSARAGTATPDGGEAAFARQVIRATLATDARALGERADSKSLAGGPLPFILPDVPHGVRPDTLPLVAMIGGGDALRGAATRHYRVRAPPVRQA